MKSSVKDNKQKICLKKFVPNKVLCNKDSSKSYNINILDNENYLILNYKTDLYNHLGCFGKRSFIFSIPKYIEKNQETFEVLGLLQAEMGKQHDGKIAFCNHEYKLINKVRRAHLELGKKQGWIKINTNLTIKQIQENIWKNVEKII